MRPLQTDADVERLVRRSAAYRAVRAALVAVDAAAASSAIARALPRGSSWRTIGAVLLIASLTHGVLETFAPSALAPAGRYVFALPGALAGALLFLTGSRTR